MRIVIYHRRRKVLNIEGGWRRQGSEYLGGGGGGGPNFSLDVTFRTLKTDNIAKLRIELKSILLEMHSNKIKGTYI